MRNYIIIIIALALSISNFISFKTTKNLNIDCDKKMAKEKSNLALKQVVNSVSTLYLF